MKTHRLILLIAIGLAGPATCLGATFTVEIRNFYFTPTNLVIQPGDTVIWRNTSFTPHDSTHNAPPGSRLWASPVLAQNETFSHTFTQAGFFRYMCGLHVGTFPQQTGTVSVVAANVAPTVQITSPAAGSVFGAPASFTVTASAADSDGTVTSVQFFANGAPLGTSAGPQFAVAVDSLPAGNHTLTAVATDDKGATGTSTPVNFSVQELVFHPLVVSSSPSMGGTISLAPPQPAGGYAEGTSVTLTAVPAEGFTFNNWSGHASGSDNPLTVTMQSPRNIVANFSPVVLPTYPLTINVDPLGGGTVNVNPAPNAANNTYVQGTVVTLTAVPGAGFAFTNWSGDVSGTSNITTVLIDGPRSVAAHFTPIQPDMHHLTVSVTPPDAGHIFVTPPNSNGVYAAGTQLALSAQPAHGFRFLRWTGAVTATNNPIPFVIQADATLTAEFEREAGLDFADVRGVYAGLLMDDTGTNQSASGFVKIRVSKTGSFHGVAMLGGIRTPLRGQFDRFGYAPLVARGATLLGSLQFDSTAFTINGTLSDEALTTTTAIRLHARSATAPDLTGSYSAMFPPAEPVANPGLAVLDVRPDGTVRIRGRLGDGTRILQRTFVTPDGEVPFFVPLYQRSGAILGWISLLSDQSAVSWFRPRDSRHAEHPDGFSVRLIVEVLPD